MGDRKRDFYFRFLYIHITIVTGSLIISIAELLSWIVGIFVTEVILPLNGSVPMLVYFWNCPILYVLTWKYFWVVLILFYFPFFNNFCVFGHYILILWFILLVISDLLWIDLPLFFGLIWYKYYGLIDVLEEILY